MRRPKFFRKPIKTNYEFEDGESIEEKVKRIVENKEPITDGAPIIYTKREDGVLPGYNIRTDRWDVAQNAMDAIHKQQAAKAKSFGVKKEDIIEGKKGQESSETLETGNKEA